MTTTNMFENEQDVLMAMDAAEAGEAGHWPTVAAVLHDKVLSLRSEYDLALEENRRLREENARLKEDQ